MVLEHGLGVRNGAGAGLLVRLCDSAMVPQRRGQVLVGGLIVGSDSKRVLPEQNAVAPVGGLFPREDRAGSDRASSN